MNLQASIANKDGIDKIALRLGCSKSTIYRELIRNSKEVEGKNQHCPKTLYSYICNGCPNRAYCHLLKHYYDYRYAEELTANRRKSSRSSPKIPPSDIKMIDEAVTEGVRQGQSLHHIYIANASLKSLCSERTIRRLCYRGNLSVKPHELRRYVRYKRECLKGHKDMAPRDIRVLLGRTYKDYLRKSSSNKRMNVVQYDSVIGKLEDTLAILTITFPKYSFQFGRVIAKGDTKSVNAAIRKIFLDVGVDNVKRIFPINLADNGTEFTSFSKIEITSYGEKICDTYYTNPYKATDKAECERCHELVRYCLPKGKSLNSINQEMLDEMFSNINSYTRESLHDQTPYALVLRKYGKAFLEAIRIHRVNKKKVRLTQLV